jgi:hypothetical protein
VPVRGQDLDDEQPLCLTVVHQDRVNAPLRVPRAARLDLDLLRPYQERLLAVLRGSRTDRQLQVTHRLYRVIRPRREVERIRRSLEDGVAPPDAPPPAARDRDVAVAGENHEADLLGVRVPLDGPSVREPQHFEADVLPIGGLRRDPHDAAAGVRRFVGAYHKIRHALNPFLNPDTRSLSYRYWRSACLPSAYALRAAATLSISETSATGTSQNDS